MKILSNFINIIERIGDSVYINGNIHMYCTLTQCLAIKMGQSMASGVPTSIVNA